ncbi:unnamed protein product [Pylaiella littoralis]
MHTMLGNMSLADRRSFLGVEDSLANASAPRVSVGRGSGAVGKSAGASRPPRVKSAGRSRGVVKTRAGDSQQSSVELDAKIAERMQQEELDSVVREEEVLARDAEFARSLQSENGEGDLSFSSTGSDACTGSRFGVLCPSDDDDDSVASPVHVSPSVKWQVVEPTGMRVRRKEWGHFSCSISTSRCW